MNDVELEELKEKCTSKLSNFEKMLSSSQYESFLELEHIYEELKEHEIEHAVKK